MKEVVTKPVLVVPTKLIKKKRRSSFRKNIPVREIRVKSVPEHHFLKFQIYCKERKLCMSAVVRWYIRNHNTVVNKASLYQSTPQQTTSLLAKRLHRAQNSYTLCKKLGRSKRWKIIKLNRKVKKMAQRITKLRLRVKVLKLQK